MNTEKPMERLATIKEACAYGKIGRTKLYEKLNANLIRAFTREGRTLIDLDSIDAMNRALLKPWTPRAKQESNVGAVKRKRL
ncbi:DNA-binding protein [Bradyrhizobium yuanmingense]|uniref:helix-turn-helix domain-containing protein n=1 Tax=Bradyrhizobium yuanmingense TaxID=108015 RepID=UPI000FE4118F|nr:helix-turn-helix domain-containing protein [Bradyrhizobium yuanmingense]TGN89938.1 DNA-binding protein [Bradyrhizobium yuanmingense]